MMTKPFRATAPENHWTGTVAADRAANGTATADICDWLKKRNLYPDGYFMVGFRVCAADPVADSQGRLHVTALFTTQGGYASPEDRVNNSRGPIAVSRVSFRIDANEFFALFKNFSMALSKPGMSIDGREYTYLNV